MRKVQKGIPMDPAPVADDKLTANLSSLMHNRYFLLALIFTVVSIVYWTLYAVNAYNHFIYASDFGYYLYNMYYDIHYPNIMGGLQLLVFGQHIAPDQLAVLLIYSIFQSPLTLPIVQLIALSLTGLLVFWVTKDLLKNDKLALILCTAYLLNPGMHGALIFDYHAEFLIIPFFIATFYFYMKASFRYFFVSLLLLLGTIESSYAVAFALGLGLLLYEMMHNIDAHSKQTRIKFAYMIIIGSIGALLFYNTIYFALPTEQVSVSHGILPIFAVSTYPLVPIVGGTASPGNEGLILSRGGVSLSTIPYVIYALIVVFFGFGIALFFDPISAIIFSVPWLVVLFVFKNIGFALVSQQYFTFVVAGAFAATILGFKLYENNSSPLTKYIPALKTMVQRQDFGNILAYSTLGLAVIIYLLSFLFRISWALIIIAAGFIFGGTCL